MRKKYEVIVNGTNYLLKKNGKTGIGTQKRGQYPLTPVKGSVPFKSCSANLKTASGVFTWDRQLHQGKLVRQGQIPE